MRPQARLDALGVTFVDPRLEAQLTDGLAAVEERMREAVQSSFPFVTETARHLVEAGGKRFRPLLVLLAGRFGDPEAPGVVPAAVAIELTHLSTLYHDDVMDEAPLRRGAPSANSRWGNTIAILTGDFLFARASEITADLGTEATRILARTIALLCEGQIRETVGPQDADPVEHYLRVVAEKTGSLIATSARLGAMLAGADDATVHALASYGERIGVAFQLSDDLLDVVGSEREFGKTPGTDLREGVATLPVLLARRATDAGSARLRELLAAPPADESALAETLALLRAHPAIDEARAELRRWADAATASIADLPEGPAKSALVTLADVVVDRTV